eukprot:TRINITY_DN6874_c0_g1_i19.p1 TRINITY_DN6874_c0_g1~~TRINITY_DN6874_c0_g1_i19.p1  ORF type:complete len:242 (-),score=77.34 TRINITY_DN6874_c0_g1_i19:25-750(-)
MRRKMQRYYEDNKEKKRRYREDNKETINEKMRKYREDNKEAIKKKDRSRKRKPRKSKLWTNDKLNEFFVLATEKLHISDPTSDWYRVSRKQVLKIGGGSLFNAFRNLGEALQFAFPEIGWDKAKFSKSMKKSTQRWLRVILEQILPSKTDIFEDFLHPDLLWEENTKFKMELDIWIPKYQLAIEYQGEQHYYGVLAWATHQDQRERDTIKKRICQDNNLRLICVPYWWDNSPQTLKSLLEV